jgi:hypothetical protein
LIYQTGFFVELGDSAVYREHYQYSRIGAVVTSAYEPTRLQNRARKAKAGLYPAFHLVHLSAC